MKNSRIARFINEKCSSNDITIWLLSRKLAQLDRKLNRSSASEKDFSERDRVEAELEAAKKFLC